MTEVRSSEQPATVGTPSPPTTAPPPSHSWRSVLTATELDTRLLGMVIALGVIWIAFNIRSGGDFLTARNLWNLSVQSTSIAIMATGMVLIIVSRNIDLSVGSLLGFLGYTMALVQTDGMIAVFGLDVTFAGLRGSSYAWVVALVVGAVLGALDRRRDGVHRRLRRGPLVHRDPRRLPRLAGRHLPHRGQAGADARPARRDVPAHRRWSDEDRWGSGGAGCSPSWPVPVSDSASTCRAGVDSATTLPCGRCGWTWGSAWSAAWPWWPASH